ncbi:RING-H2 finger protein ATL39-like [Curcuma longa]|uniref:RING-H2 finger protein ATL39-like n=1 Tax=Curcuma longa TaxID=136217 RepID=UPI003D9F3663
MTISEEVNREATASYTMEEVIKHNDGTSPRRSRGPSDSSNLDTSIQVVGISFGVFLVLYLAIHYSRPLLEWWRPSPAGAGAVARARRPKAGLDPSAIASLPSFPYRKGIDGGAAGVRPMPAPDCVVCLSALQDGETVRALPGCTHVFHAPCIDSWLQKHSTCPTCRADVHPPPPPPVGAGAVVLDLVETSGTKKAEVGSTSAM